MRGCKRNQQPVWYSNFLGEQEIADDDGYLTGETAATYSEPKQIRANVGMPNGYAESASFGTNVSYDRVIIADKMDVTEGSRIWVGITPEKNTPHNFVVVKVAPSLNFVLVAISGVEVSA